MLTQGLFQMCSSRLVNLNEGPQTGTLAWIEATLLVELMAAYCPHCGRKANEGDACAHCGKRLDQPANIGARRNKNYRPPPPSGLSGAYAAATKRPGAEYKPPPKSEDTADGPTAKKPGKAHIPSKISGGSFELPSRASSDAYPSAKRLSKVRSTAKETFTTAPYPSASGGRTQTLEVIAVAARKLVRKPIVIAFGISAALALVLLFLAYDPRAKVSSLDELPGGLTVADLNLAVITDTFPATPVGDRMSWALSELNSLGANLDDGTLREQFSAQLVAGGIRQGLLQVIAETSAVCGPFGLVGFYEIPTDYSGIAVMSTSSERWVALTVSTDTAPPHRITELWVQYYYPFE